MTRLIIHAPTASALERARSNAKNLLEAEPDANVEIIVNAEAVKEALEDPDPQTARLTRLCGNSLTRQCLTQSMYRTVDAAVLYITRRQEEGWSYLRA